jgi:hypothetical protein
MGYFMKVAEMVSKSIARHAEGTYLKGLNSMYLQINIKLGVESKNVLDTSCGRVKWLTSGDFTQRRRG